MIKMYFPLQNEFRLTFKMYDTKYYNNLELYTQCIYKIKVHFQAKQYT